MGTFGYGIFYAPAVALFLNFQHLSEPYLLYCSGICLIAASVKHGVEFSVYGTDDPTTNPKASADHNSRMQAAIWDGDPDDFPESMKLIRRTVQGEDIRFPFKIRRLPVFLLFAASQLALSLGSIWSMWLYSRRLSNLQIFEVAILFVLIASLLRGTIWKVFPAVFYSEDYDNASSIVQVHDSMDQLLYTINEIDGLLVNDLHYNVIDGGVVHLDYHSNHNFDSYGEKEGRVVSFGFIGLVNHTDFPVSRLEVSFHNPETEGEYYIQSDWVRSHQNGELENEEYLELIAETIEYSSKKGGSEG